MRKLALCKCENKDADQLCGNHAADLRLCFRYMDKKSLYLLNLKIQNSSYLERVGNLKGRFSYVSAHLMFLARKQHKQLRIA